MPDSSLAIFAEDFCPEKETSMSHHITESMINLNIYN